MAKEENELLYKEFLLGPEFMYQKPFKNDSGLFATLRDTVDSSLGWYFQPNTFQGRIVNHYDSESFLELERFTRNTPLLDINFRDATVVLDGVGVDVTTVGATDRSTGGEMSGSLWIRDQAQIAYRLMKLYQMDPEKNAKLGASANKLLLSLLTIMSTPAQLGRFDDIISHKENKKYSDNQTNNPHIFMHYSNLDSKVTEGWNHKQDAWQMLALFGLEALKSGFITPEKLEESHKEFYGKIIPFLDAVDFSNRKTAGSWEEIDAVRTSVIAWETMLIRDIVDMSRSDDYLFLKKGYDELKDSKSTNISFEEKANEMYKSGLKRIAESLPSECPLFDPDSLERRGPDAALLYLLDLDVPLALQEEGYGDAKHYEKMILDQVLRLEDTTTGGIYRYGGIDGELPDSYQGINFWTHVVGFKLSKLYGGSKPDGDTSDAWNFKKRNEIVSEGGQATWTHFTGQISVWAGYKFIDTRDIRYYDLAINYFNNFLGLATKEGEYSIIHDGNNLRVGQIPPYKMPECYIRMQDGNQRWVLPSQNTPLNWSVAIANEAFGVIGKCVAIKETS